MERDGLLGEGFLGNAEVGATQDEEAEVEADHAGEEAAGGQAVAQRFGPVRELTDAAGSPDAARSRMAGGSAAGCRAAESAIRVRARRFLANAIRILGDALAGNAQVGDGRHRSGVQPEVSLHREIIRERHLGRVSSGSNRRFVCARAWEWSVRGVSTSLLLFCATKRKKRGFLHFGILMPRGLRLTCLFPPGDEPTRRARFAARPASSSRSADQADETR